MNYLFFLLFLISAVRGGSIAKISNSDPTHLETAQPLKVQQNPKAISTPDQYAPRNPLSTSRYYFPTYPEYTNNGYPAQPEYGNYLVPSPPALQKSQNWSGSLLTTLIPLAGTLIIYAAKAGTYLVHLVVVLLAGGALTAAICTFTPLCSISILGLGINKNQVKEQVAELARTYITPESVNAATVLVSRAFDKYAAMQRENLEKQKQEKKEDPATVGAEVEIKNQTE